MASGSPSGNPPHNPHAAASASRTAPPLAPSHTPVYMHGAPVPPWAPFLSLAHARPDTGNPSRPFVVDMSDSSFNLDRRFMQSTGLRGCSGPTLRSPAEGS